MGKGLDYENLLIPMYNYQQKPSFSEGFLFFA
jgi:hypothetical protein